MFCAPKIRTKTSYASTKAYAVEIEKQNGKPMIDLLMKVYRESLQFVPFQMKQKSPQAFTNAIHRQSEQISNLYTIILQNIGEDTMYYLSHHI